MEKDFRDKLTFTQKEENEKNIIKVWQEWDSNDADYIENTFTMRPEQLFGNEKLIYCLAYITCDEDFKKGFGSNDSRFCKYIPDNEDIDELEDILSDNEFMVYSEWGECHSCVGLEITYYDEDGNKFYVTFDKIYDEFKKLSYKEICEKINSL